jgi:hypothetical protein
MIRQKKHASFILLLLILLIGGCSEKDKNPVGFGLWDEEGHWQVDQLITRDVTADSSFHVRRGSGIGPYLLVGSWEGQEARSLLAFEKGLPDTLSTPLTAVSLNLIAYSEVSDDSILISVHPLEAPWSDSTATWHYPWTTAGGDHAPEPIAQDMFATADGVEFQLTFNQTGVDLVQSWLDGDSNLGILLKAEGLEDDRMKYFYSEDTPYFPYLEMVFTAQDSADTVAVDSKKDTFIAQPVSSPEGDLLLVSDGHVTRSWIRFDLSAIPESSFINLALLSLTVSEFRDPLDNMSLRAYPVSDRQTLDYDTTPSAGVNLFPGKDVAEFNITGLVRQWVTGTENEGILLKSYLEYSSLSQSFFYSPRADSAQQPSLKIVYTARPGEAPMVRQKDLTAR